MKNDLYRQLEVVLGLRVVIPSLGEREQIELGLGERDSFMEDPSLSLASDSEVSRGSGSLRAPTLLFVS